MRGTTRSLLGILAVMMMIATPIEVKAMNKNQKYLAEAQAHAKAFEEKQDSEELEKAYLALENVVLLQETDPNIRSRSRKESLNLWLRLIALVDGFLDPHFNPNEVPERNVEPPPTSEGVIYPPGVDPALIKDPGARAQYEKDIAANRAKIAKYNMQIELRFLEERITPRAERFIRNFYTPAPRDQAELKAAIDEKLKDSARRSDFLKLLAQGRSKE